MKRFIGILAILIPCMLSAQSDGYVQFETIYLKPDFQHLKEFYAAMTAHNKKFHNSGPYTATVSSVDNGDMAGWFVWEMGPCTYAEMDARPSSKEHDDDWDFNVMPYVKDQKYAEYWRRMDDLSISKPDAPAATNYYIRFRNVNNEEGFRVMGLLKKLTAAMKEVDQPYSWDVFENQFWQGSKGRHLAFVSPFKNWAELDNDWNFKAAFEKANGENSFQGWAREMGEVFSDSWDEIWTALPELSGGGQ